MNVAKYKQEHPYCELIRHFPVDGRCHIVHLKGNTIRFPLFGGRCRIDASDLHHIIGGDPAGRTDDERNVLHLNIYVHQWVTDHPCAGRILSCWELKRKGRLDWEFLTRISRKCYPGLFENPLYLNDAERFPWIEPYRKELIRRAA